MSDTTPRDQLAALLADDWSPDRDPILTAIHHTDHTEGPLS